MGLELIHEYFNDRDVKEILSVLLDQHVLIDRRTWHFNSMGYT